MSLNSIARICDIVTLNTHVCLNFYSSHTDRMGVFFSLISIQILGRFLQHNIWIFALASGEVCVQFFYWNVKLFLFLFFFGCSISEHEGRPKAAFVSIIWDDYLQYGIQRFKISKNFCQNHWIASNLIGWVPYYKNNGKTYLSTTCRRLKVFFKTPHNSLVSGVNKVNRGR